MDVKKGYNSSLHVNVWLPLSKLETSFFFFSNNELKFKEYCSSVTLEEHIHKQVNIENQRNKLWEKPNESRGFHTGHTMVQGHLNHGLHQPTTKHQIRQYLLEGVHPSSRVQRCKESTTRSTEAARDVCGRPTSDSSKCETLTQSNVKPSSQFP